MNIFKPTFLAIFCLLVASVVTAQNNKDKRFIPTYDPPSPEASSLGKYAEHKMGYYTGTPQINISLFNISSGRINVPISLSYHASGVKVEEIPSRAGLGWTLNAGGVVTRSVKGWPDEYNENCGIDNQIIGYFNLPSNYNVDYPYSGFGETRDHEPDVYFYNFPGHTGKFFYTRSGIPRMVDKEDFIIESPQDGSGFFTITTSDALIYKFTATESTVISNSNMPCGGHSSVSAWYLTEIEDPISAKTIKFIYSSTPPPYISYDQSKYRAYLPSNLECFSSLGVGGGHNNTSKSITHINNVKILSKIEFDDGYVEFITDTQERLDLSGDKTYSEINLKNNQGDLIKGFNLNHSYASVGSNTYDKRLVLDGVQQKGASGGLLPSYTFLYKNLNLLPSRISAEKDIWGYYNANGDGETHLAPKIYIYAGTGKSTYLPFDRVSGTAPTIISGQERSCNASTVDYGTLKRITYPTGGYSEYEFEPHEFYYREGNTFYTNRKYIGGGIRIKRITDYSIANVVAKTTEYDYEVGFLGGAMPQAAHPTSDLGAGFANNLLRFSSNKAVLGANGGGIVGYKAVVEKVVNGTDFRSTSYVYLSDIDTEITPIFDTFCNSGTKNHLITNTYYPFFEMESNELSRGVLDKIRYFDDPTSQTPIKEIDYNYTMAEHEEYYVASTVQNSDLSSPISIRIKRKLQSKKLLLMSQTETEWDKNGIAFTKKTTNAYNNDFVPNGKYNLSLKSKSVYNSDGTVLRTDYKYPFDFASTASGGDMGIMGDKSNTAYMHYVSLVIQELNYVNGQLTSATINDYEPSSAGLMLPAKVYSTSISQLSSVSGVVSDPSNPGTLYEERVEYLDYISDKPQLIKYDDHFQRLEWNIKASRIKSVQIVPTANPYIFLAPPQNWSEVVSTSAKTGEKQYSSSGSYYFPNLTMQAQGTYYVSFWAKSGTIHISSGDQQAGGHISITAPSIWTRYSYILHGVDWQGLLYMSGTAILDEIRISEGKTQISTFHYDKFNRLTEVSDPNNSITHYEYDEFGRLINSKDTNEDITKAFYYNFK